jgi:hypothetical protein
MTKARDTGEVLNTRGTAATADVQTGPTDTTAGAVLVNGSWGIGEPTDFIDVNADDRVVPAKEFWGAASTNLPVAGLPFGVDITTAEPTTGSYRVKQLAFSYSTEESFERFKGSVGWSVWKPVYTGANLNPNVFGGIATNRIVAIGYAHNTSTAYFTLPTLSVSEATSITVNNTFAVYKENSVLVSSATTPTLVASSKGNTVIQVSGLTMTQGDNLTLRTEGASATITVNF